MMMRRRKKLPGRLMASLMILAVIVISPASSLLWTSNCLPGNLSTGDRCNCSWRSGKFVADCSSQALAEVPNVSRSFEVNLQRNKRTLFEFGD